MALNPQPVVIDTPPSGDEVVISGISGLYPNCHNTVELMENLYNKVDMVEEVSYNNVQHPKLPKHLGKIKGFNKFDAQFFKVTHWQAQTLDPMTKKVLECGFSAIYDSGVNPASLAGTKLGVFVGSSYSDDSTLKLLDCVNGNAFVISGCGRSMSANRVSYWIDSKSPSFGLDQACASSTACLEIAYNSINRGDCDSALVAGCNLCVQPLLSLNISISGQLCLDGKTKCFDKNGDGYVRSEAINVLFLQKAKDAKRIYTEICHIKSKYVMRPDANFLALRKSKDMEQFLAEFYSEVTISPSAVEYVEAYGSGKAEADGNELNAIGNFFAKSRSVKVGSVKSNMGHTEAASGVCAVTKANLKLRVSNMAPNPQSEISSLPPSGDEIVISGMGGLFPNCATTVALMKNLYNKVDMVEEVCYDNVRHPNLPRHQGKIKDLNKFDAQFFKVTHWQAESLDSMSRKVMECAFSAIYDAGVNPVSLAGTKLGVFVAGSCSDNSSLNMYDDSNGNAFIISGCSRSMLASRISYWIDGKRPSYSLDQACASSMACLEIAYNSIKRGDCDSALVGGCNMCVHPLMCLNMRNAGHLCLDGKTKCFDKNGDGYVRSEAINILFLQKAKDAKRIYTEICHIKSKYFIRPDANFLALRNSEDLEQFLQEFYSEVKISPSTIEYVEAFGAGIAEADGNELNAIGNFFAKSRSVKVGSVKSNMGHTEAANGVCAVTKMCLAYHKGELPGNLYYNEPQEHIPAVRDGRIQVVTENTPFTRGYTAINSFSYTGANYHVLLNGHYKNKDKSHYQSSIPRLILLSGREKNGMNKVMDILTNQPVDPEQIALFHNIYKQNIGGHTGRGYVVLDTNENNETISLARNFEFHSGATRSVCFLYSGMGSQWCGMGTELMRIPIFADAIERCRKVLDPLGVDIIKILTDPDKTILDSILNNMVGITAVQIGLTDILKAIGIVPDHIIGHSMGELGCAYADGCFTAEETVLSSYSRGLVSVQTPFIKGAMAAIGLGYKEMLPLCPPEIEVACHNSSESTTISGPAEVMAHFLSNLTSRGVFAREVACSNIAYHSKYVAEAGPLLRSLMQNLIKDPKLRSEKWISSSVLHENWNQDFAKYASAEYFTNNLLSPVYFEENSSLIPKDAIIIEIAPHGLLQAIVKKSHENCINVPLAKRGSSDSVTFFLEALGKLYLNGQNSSVDALHPKVEFPVSTETSLLSHLVEWEHSVNWPESLTNNKEVKETSERNFVISVHDDDYKFVEGHVRNGVNEFPESALLILVWETYGMYKGKYYKDMSVTFNDVMFHSQVKLDIEDVTRLRLMIYQGSNRFELSNANLLVVTGFITEEENIAQDSSITENVYQYDIRLNENDVYALLCMKGYSYKGDLRSVHSLGANNEGLVKWAGEWAPFLDSLFQLIVLARDHDGVSLPKIIQQLSINVHEHDYMQKLSTVLDNVPCYKTEMLKSNAALRCGGVMLEGITFEDVPKLEQQPGVLLSQEFLPHISTEYVNLETAVSINLQIVEDNVNRGDKIKVVELVTSSSESISNYIRKIANNMPSNVFDISSTEIVQNNIHAQDVKEAKLLVVHNLFQNRKNLYLMEPILEKKKFVLTLEQADYFNKNNVLDMTIITMMKTHIGLLVLLKKGNEHDKENVLYIPIHKDRQFSWWPQIQSELEKSRKVVLVSERQPHCGLFGFVKQLQNTGRKIGVVVVNDYHTSSFTPDSDIYKAQLQNNLNFNVLNKGQWGSYYYVPKSESFKTSNVSLTSRTFEDLDNFTWTEIPAPAKENFVQISYAGLSIRDCRRALGNVKDKSTSFGMDYSGINSQGKAVMGMVASGALGSAVEADSSLSWLVPQCWSLEDAATVPRPYVHAYYCLVIKGNLQRNKTVLVTCGSWAFGQAVISICLSFDCTVFTTVGDENERKLVLKLFPKLKEENIILAHDELFYVPLFNLTKNKKCNFVVNCYSGLMREAGIKCVRFLGTFLDVSDVDMMANKSFGMACVDLKSYVAVNLTSLFTPGNYGQKKQLQKMVADGIANGTVRPLTRVVYTPSEVSRAFKLVSSGRNRGRALIKVNFTEALKVIPRISFSNGAHIVVCDRTNVGVELINHLVRNGAKNVIVNVKHDYDTNYLNAKSVTWKKNDIKIEYNSEDLQTKQGCENLLNAGKKLAQIAGIFIVQDYKEKKSNDIIDQSDLNAAFNETVLVTNNLDKTSRTMCNGISYFVHISISAQNIENEYAISACARICEARKEIGLPALFLCCKVPKYEVHKEHNDLLSKLELPTVSALFNAMEISLKQNTNNVFMLNLPEQSPSKYIWKLEALIGVRNIEDVDENKMLSEICTVNEERVKEIKRGLSPITDSVEDLDKILVGSLKNMCKSFNIRINTNFNKGLGAFYDYVEEDEYVAVDAVIPMNTYLTSFEEIGFFNRDDTYLIMIPGFEGHHRVFNFLAERIKVRAATLQLGPDLMSQSIPEIAKTMANLIKTNFEMSSKFYILGYSFGVNVALEVAKILEAEGKTGVVYCLDSSPDALKVQLHAYAGNFTDDHLENSILEHMYCLISRQEDTELKHYLDKHDSWAGKLEACFTKLRRQVHFSSEHIRSILQSAYDRIKLAREYNPEMKLQSEIVLIRGIPHPNAKNLPDDYNLSKYTTKPVRVFDIESDHVSAPYDCRVSNVVNKLLDSKILEEFKKKNLCEIYYRVPTTCVRNRRNVNSVDN